MNPITRYLFEPKIDKDGSRLPFSRMDIVFSVVLAVALMVIASLAFEPAITTQALNLQQKRNIVVWSVLTLGIVLFNGRRRVLLGTALSLVAIRLMIAVLFVNHGPLMVGLCVFTTAASYLLLRRYRY